MSRVSQYIAEFGITDEQMNAARAETQAYVDAYNLQKSRRARDMTQAKPDQTVCALPDCVSCMEDGAISSIHLDNRQG